MIVVRGSWVCGVIMIAHDAYQQDVNEKEEHV